MKIWALIGALLFAVLPMTAQERKDSTQNLSALQVSAVADSIVSVLSPDSLLTDTLVVDADTLVVDTLLVDSLGVDSLVADSLLRDSLAVDSLLTDSLVVPTDSLQSVAGLSKNNNGNKSVITDKSADYRAKENVVVNESATLSPMRRRVSPTPQQHTAPTINNKRNARARTSCVSSPPPPPPPAPVMKTPPVMNTDSIDALQKLIRRQQDTISQLRQQLAAVTEQTAEHTGTSSYLWALLLLLALVAAFLLLRYYLMSRADRSGQSASDEQLLRQQHESLVKKDREIASLQAAVEAAQNMAAQAVNEAAALKTAAAEAQQKVEDMEKLSAASSKPALVQPTGKQPTVDADAPLTSLSHGKQLYEQLKAGGVSAAAWSSEDILHLVEYYQLENKELVERMQHDYQSLSPNQKLFFILTDMGKTDAEIQRILNITQITIRSIRHRIKAKFRGKKGGEMTIKF